MTLSSAAPAAVQAAPSKDVLPEQKLKALGLVLPQPAAALASYAPFAISGNLLIISGQLPLENGKLAFTGKLGAGVDLAEGQKAARLCAINILAQARIALGSLDRIGRCLRLGGFIASAPDFTDQHKVMNGCSDLMLEVLGEAGRHARAAVGVPALPLDAAVESEAMFEIKD